MSSRLSTSSFSLTLGGVLPFADAPAKCAARWTRRLPWGALVGLLCVTIAHLWIAEVVVPHPIAREALRRKVIALTQHDRPSLLIAGDSRAQTGVIPDVVASGLGWPTGSVVNTGLYVCESSAVLAAYREFSRRFAPRPIVVLGVSLFSVNDGATAPAFLNDEVLGSLGFLDRCRLAGIPRAWAATFLPEKALWRRWRAEWDSGSWDATEVAERGYCELPRGAVDAFAPQSIRQQMSNFQEQWFGRAKLDGIRWRQLERDARDLRNSGAEIVLLDTPFHPGFREGIAQTAMEKVARDYDARLGLFAEHHKIPLLRYEAAMLTGDDPSTLFHDLAHLNRRGAEILSARLSQNLARLMENGDLRSPDLSALECILEPLSPAGGEDRVRGFQDALLQSFTQNH